MTESVSALTRRFSELGLSEEEWSYLRFNSRRYVHLLDGIATCLRALPDHRAQRPMILDVGPAFQTLLLRERFPNATVNTVGYANRLAEPRSGEQHVGFDLNIAYKRKDWPGLPGHDIVVMAEVIEHLSTSPLELLRCVKTWMAPGGWLVIQTPNALALASRLRMLAGRNPLGPIADLTSGSHNPGHFREYTLDEVAEVGRAAGFEITERSIGNYFTHPGVAGQLYDWVTAILPRGMRQGITIHLRKPPNAAVSRSDPRD